MRHLIFPGGALTPRFGRNRSLPSAGSGDVAPPPAASGKLPPTGGFNRGQYMYDHLNGAGDIWYDAGNPLQNSTNVYNWIHAKFSYGPSGGQAMWHPRPKHVKLYFQGFVPILQFSYQDAANNTAGFQNEWKKIAKNCLDAGYDDVIFSSSETNQPWKKWMPQAADMTSGRWERAWKNMVNAVRSVMPEAKFAFVPYSSGSDAGNLPGNGRNSKDEWHVSGNDADGRPWMDFWGCTFYLTTREAGCSADSGCKVTNEVIDRSIAGMRAKDQNNDKNWSTMGHIVYARSIGKRAFMGECGIMNRFANGEKPFHMGDEPYSIDVLTKFVLDYRADIEATVWFNALNMESGKRAYSCLDGASGCTLPNAARRVKELWGPNSPFR